VLLADKPGECLSGASVTLTATADGKTLTTKTDFFGDFEFKGLNAEAEYRLCIEYPEYEPECIPLRLVESVNVGEVLLSAKVPVAG